MSKKKRNNENPYSKAAMQREAQRMAEARAAARKHTVKIVCIILAALVAVSGIVTASILIFGKRDDRMISRAEKYLTQSPYRLVLSTGVDSTDASIEQAIGFESTNVALTVDGDGFRLVVPIGAASVSYLYFDSMLYIDESVINVCTKQKITDEQTVAKMWEQYVTPYITVFTADHYGDFSVAKDGKGNKTLVLTDLIESQVKVFEDAMKNAAGSDADNAVATIDDELTKATVVFDSEGRYTSIEQVYAMALEYSDGYTALITLTAKKTYSYGENIELTVPGNERQFIDIDGDYKDLFGSSFTVQTDVGTTTQDKTILNRLKALGLITHNILRVDGNNFECVYPNTNVPQEGAQIADGLTETMTLDGNTLYLYGSVIKDGAEDENYSYRVKEILSADKRKQFYANHVMSNIIPAHARDYVDIKISTDAEGVTTVTCTGINQEYYDYINYMLNYEYVLGNSPLQITPASDKCKYTVKYDASGRFLSTSILFYVTPSDLTGSYADEYILITRTFDYDAAEDYYEAAGEDADPWITAPENADDYVRDEI